MEKVALVIGWIGALLIGASYYLQPTLMQLAGMHGGF